MDLAQVNCKICNNLLCRPISTPCGHNFCKLCIQEVSRTSINTPRCPSCQEKISSSYEINKLIESVIQYQWPKAYKSRLSEPGIKLKVSLYSIWKFSILQTTETISLIVLPVLFFAFLCKYVKNFPRVFITFIKLLVKIGSYKSTSLMWQALWAVIHMIIKYLEATSLLSNIID